ncbi:MAG TPA: poly-gamma-glutamate hydrolase family protein [Steroidobacteraceae bacterium]|nr:poly-gamma-glutamate hydrolase family protein [Steroidobacteraceae bacterium]
MKHPSAEYECYADLAEAQVEGADFQIHIERRATSGIAVVAPHGGAIEEGTSEIARAVAGSEFNLYLFEGLRASGSYAALHLTSHCFDEPQCLALLAGCDQVIAIHGCRGAEPEALLGGLDEELKVRIGAAIAAAGIETRLAGHRYPAVHRHNICNRGRGGAGVQIELTSALRLEQANQPIIDAIRSVLLTL